MDMKEVDEQLRIEKATGSSNNTTPSISSNDLHHSSQDKTVIQFEPDDPGNPHNWPTVSLTLQQNERYVETTTLTCSCSLGNSSPLAYPYYVS